jgi:hypothetical protein
MRILLDSDALVKLTKAGIKELVAETFSISIPEAVRVEVVEEGKLCGHPDAISVEQNIAAGRIRIEQVASLEPPEADLFSGGDRAIVSLSLTRTFAATVTDDAALLDRLKSLGVSATVPAALLLAVGRRRRLAGKRVLALLESLRPYISMDEYVTFRLVLERRYPGK